MGLVPDRGPNPNITDVNDPRYTELSKFGDNWIRNGLIGDARTFLGAAYEPSFTEHNMLKDVGVGDIAVLGNRAGLVTAVTKNGSSGLVETITIYEDYRYLPKDWQATPGLYGYNNDATKVGKTTKYLMRDITSTGSPQPNDGGVASVTYTGIVLIFPKKTTDMATWSKLEQSAAAFNALYPIGNTSLSLTVISAVFSSGNLTVVMDVKKADGTPISYFDKTYFQIKNSANATVHPIGTFVESVPGVSGRYNFTTTGGAFPNAAADVIVNFAQAALAGITYNLATTTHDVT